MATGFNTQVGNGKYSLQFETDSREYYLLMQSTARRCVDGAHMTNADRIRVMSDEELAKIIEHELLEIVKRCPEIAVLAGFTGFSSQRKENDYGKETK